MIVWFTSGQSLASCLKPILWFAAPFFVAIVVLSLFLSPWAEQRKLEFERQLESRDEIALLSPGLFREFRRANLVVYLESINTFDGTIRNIFLHSVDEGKDVTTVAPLGLAAGRPQTATASSSSTTAAATKARPAAPNTGSSNSAGSAAASSRPSCARCRPRPRRSRRRRCSSLDGQDRARRAVLAAVGADLGADADAARRPAGARQSADGPLVQPDRRGAFSTSSTATASTSCRASSPRASSASGSASRCRTDRRRRGPRCSSAISSRCSRGCAAPRPAPAAA